MLLQLLQLNQLYLDLLFIHRFFGVGMLGFLNGDVSLEITFLNHKTCLVSLLLESYFMKLKIDLLQLEIFKYTGKY